MTDSIQRQPLADKAFVYDHAAVLAKLKSKPDSAGQRIFGENEVFRALTAKVFGQDLACRTVDRVLTVKMAREKAVEPAVILLAGPPGTGKSWIPECLHRHLTGEDGVAGMCYIDCGKLKNVEQAKNELFGMSKGYVGAEEGGKLVKAIESRPDAVVLLDEFEKAARPVQEMLLVAFQAGFMDNEYTKTKVSCSRSIFFLTTNKNQRQIAPIVATMKTRRERHDLLKKSYVECDFLAPEFADRIDAFLWLDRLSDVHLINMAAGLFRSQIEALDSRTEIVHVETDVVVWLVEQMERTGSIRETKRMFGEPCGLDFVALKRSNRQGRITIVMYDDPEEGLRPRVVASV